MMELRLGLYPGTSATSNAGQRPMIEAWFGRQSGGVSAHEAPWPLYGILRLMLGWERPCVAYVEEDSQ